MGVLHYPLDPSGTRVSIDDRGSSVEVFLVLFVNCRESMVAIRNSILILWFESTCYGATCEAWD